jgi:hypothetical protein
MAPTEATALDSHDTQQFVTVVPLRSGIVASIVARLAARLPSGRGAVVTWVAVLLGSAALAVGARRTTGAKASSTAAAITGPAALAMLYLLQRRLFATSQPRPMRPTLTEDDYRDMRGIVPVRGVAAGGS